jgi:hypothetical protein
MTITLKAPTSCDILNLEENYQGIFVGHAFSKAYQYATMDENVCKNLTYIVRKFIEVYISTVKKIWESLTRVEQGMR